MAGRRRRWVLVAFGVAVLLVFVGIGAIIAVTAWFQQNLEIQTRTSEEAESDFDAVRKQFAGRAPLLTLHDGKPAYSPERAIAAPGAKLETLFVLVWEPEDDHLARFSLPFWLLRMKSDPIRFGAYSRGLDDRGVTLRPEDIEKYGPGIILDAAMSSGERVLLWAQ